VFSLFPNRLAVVTVKFIRVDRRALIKTAKIIMIVGRIESQAESQLTGSQRTKRSKC